MNLLRMAWRNLWRNKRRTAITFAAISVGMALVVTTLCLLLGVKRDLRYTATSRVVGQVQIHHPNYLAERSIYDTIDGTEEIFASARSAGIGFAPRSLGSALVLKDSSSAGARIWGVDPGAERGVSDLPNLVMKGTYLPDLPEKKVVLGCKLAKILDAQVDSELAMIVRAADGSLGTELFNVCGILECVGESVDRGAAMMHQNNFESLFSLEGKYHQIAFNTRGRFTPEEIIKALSESMGNNQAKTWREFLPIVSDFFNAFNRLLLISGSVFFIATGLGVLNTMLMSTYDRIPEFGLMKALGASPLRVVSEVAAEALILGAMSTLVGWTTGCLLAWYFQHNPIDLTGFASEGLHSAGIAFDAYWHAYIDPGWICVPIVQMLSVSFLAALYPAVKAARLDPVEAMRHT